MAVRPLVTLDELDQATPDDERGVALMLCCPRHPDRLLSKHIRTPITEIHQRFHAAGKAKTLHVDGIHTTVFAGGDGDKYSVSCRARGCRLDAELAVTGISRVLTWLAGEYGEGVWVTSTSWAERVINRPDTWPQVFPVIRKT